MNIELQRYAKKMNCRFFFIMFARKVRRSPTAAAGPGGGLGCARRLQAWNPGGGPIDGLAGALGLSGGYGAAAVDGEGHGGAADGHDEKEGVEEVDGAHGHGEGADDEVAVAHAHDAELLLQEAYREAQ